MTNRDTRDPRDLRPHALIKELPRWDREDPHWLGFVNDIQQHGVLHPLLITQGNVVVDGETRRQGAIAAGLEQVPVEFADESQAATIIMREMALRRNLTKGAIAYLTVSSGLLDRVFEEARERQNARLKKGQVSVVDSIDNGSLDGIACELGLGRDLLFQARKVVKIFAEDDAYRVDLEPKVLAGEVGLGAVIAGYAGRKTTAGVDRKDRPTEILFRTGLRTLFLRASRFEDKQQLRVAVRQEVEQVKPEELGLLEDVASVIKQCVTQRLRTLGTE